VASQGDPRKGGVDLFVRRGLIWHPQAENRIDYHPVFRGIWRVRGTAYDNKACRYGLSATTFSQNLLMSLFCSCVARFEYFGHVSGSSR